MKALNRDPKSFLPLPDNVWHILMVLGDGNAKHGYAINKQLEAEGGSRLSAATLYRTIRDMLEQGLIEEVAAPADETDERRRYYRVTGLAREIVRAEMDRVHQAASKPAYSGSPTWGGV